jgi:hypothetical protein
MPNPEKSKSHREDSEDEIPVNVISNHFFPLSYVLWFEFWLFSVIPNYETESNRIDEREEINELMTITNRNVIEYPWVMNY